MQTHKPTINTPPNTPFILTTKSINQHLSIQSTMAIKLTFAAALLVALVTVATASRYTTTVTTTTFEDEANPGQQQQQCQRQLQGRQFQSCQRYLSHRSSNEEDDEVLEMSTDNPGQRQQRLQQCCDQLRNVNEQCRCEAIKHTVRQLQQQQQQEGQQQTGQSQKVYARATELPRRCNFRQQQCQIKVVFV
ncbi:hypothetical protein CASFOL_013499 [Castilleja foliolosa]|uniref:Bifunctional inhibitor/plant lipid transfer protein/seed storage helical domain-containing protein n=1 Tax=Castilleja foliolosa TaxID=1961234 RepID=A0ABD3DP20_9LAMI